MPSSQAMAPFIYDHFRLNAMMYLLLSIAGLIGGFIAGLTGIGTGFLMIVVIPLAFQYMGMSQGEIVRFTIANTLFATMCSAMVNNLTMWRKKRLYIKETLLVTLTAVVSASTILYFFVLRETYSSESYNAVIVIFLAYIIFRTINKLRKPLHYEEEHNSLKLSAIGISGGLVSSLTGLGGGSVFIPMLNLWLKTDIKKAKSISYGAILGISVILTILNLSNSPDSQIPYAHVGYILLPVSIPLSIGVIIASPFGISFSDKLSSRTITIIFLIIISAVLIRKLLELWAAA